MLAPMTLRDRVLGVISFVSAESGRRFDEHDLALAEDLALRAAAAVENARLFETASAIAQTLQTSLLPPVLPELPGMELAAAYLPAGKGYEVGGDFYDVFNTADDQWYLVIGDVCGKGAEAAAVTALARYTIRAAAVRRRSPAAILRWLSDAMLQQAERRRALLHDRLRAPGPRPLAGPRDRRVRRPPAAATGARGPQLGGGRGPGDAARAGAAARACRTARRSCATATRSCSTPTG